MAAATLGTTRAMAEGGAGQPGVTDSLANPNAVSATPGMGNASPTMAPLMGAPVAPNGNLHAARAAVELHAPPGSAAFADELTERVAVLVQQDAGGATLKLNPGHLGPVDVRVQVRDGEASVVFAAHHAATREALENAAPRLREQLAQQGYTQVNVDVAAQGQDLAQRQAQQQAQRDAAALASRDAGLNRAWRQATEGSTSTVAGASPRRSGGGRLDAYA
jgi:flagellar hook-length control protein FliK